MTTEWVHTGKGIYIFVDQKRYRSIKEIEMKEIQYGIWKTENKIEATSFAVT